MEKTISLLPRQIGKIYQNPDDFILIEEGVSLKFIKEKEGKLHKVGGPYNCEYERECELTVLCKETNKEYVMTVYEGGQYADDMQLIGYPTLTL